MTKKTFARTTTVVLSMSMMLSMCVIPHYAGAKTLKPSLSLTNLAIQKGQSKTVKVKNVKAQKVNWRLSKKKIVTLSKKSKKGVTVKAVSKGTTILRASIKTARNQTSVKRVKIVVSDTVSNSVNAKATSIPGANVTQVTASAASTAASSNSSPAQTSAATPYITIQPGIADTPVQPTSVPYTPTNVPADLPADQTTAPVQATPIAHDTSASMSFCFSDTGVIPYDTEGTATTSTMIADRTVTITEPGEYAFYGQCSEGQIVVNIDKALYPKSDTYDNTVTLSLQGLTLSNTASSPVYIAAIDDECTIQVKKDTLNTLSDGTSYTNPDSGMGVIYSHDDVKIKGKGKLVINANADDGIVCKDDLKIYNGDITVNAVDDAIRGNDSVRIGNPDDIAVEGAYDDLSINVSSQKGAGIKSNNSTDEGKGYITVSGGNISAETTGDCLHAYGTISVLGGTLTLSSGDDGIHSDTTLILGTTDGSDDDFLINITKSYEGIEAYDIEIYSGKTLIVASDDGVNAAGGNDSSGTVNNDTFQPGGWGGGGFGGSSSSGIINMTGGYIYSRASGDGIDSNGNITMTGGTMLVCGPTKGGNGIFDIGDSGCTFTHKGGIIFGLGTSDMAVYPNSSYINASGTLSPGSVIAVADSSGNAVAALTVPQDINMTGLVEFSNAQATSSTYSVYSGVTYSGTLDQSGFGVGGTITGGTKMTAGSTSTGGWGGGSMRPGR